MTRAELIAALHSATGTSRELDAEIAFQTGEFGRYLMGLNDCHIVSVTPAADDFAEILIRANNRTTGGVQYTSDLPHYTSSLDAALTLVPKGFWWAAGECERECHASIGLEGCTGEDQVWDASDTTPPNVPIALLIAIFRTIKARSPTDGR